MEYTRAELAKTLGCTKPTVAKAIKELSIAEHVTRRGNTEYLDEFAASAVADKLSKKFKTPEPEPEANVYKSLYERERADRTAAAKEYQERIDQLQKRIAELETDLKDERSSKDRLTAQIMDMNEKLLAQQKPRGFFARLLGSGD